MNRTFRQVAIVGLLVLAASMTAYAQRGGGFGGFFSSSYYSASVKYDGKFTFVRMSYPATGRGNDPGRPAWSHDFPDGERHLMSILTTVSNVNAHVDETAIISFSDPEMFKHPVIYLCEPGYLTMTDQDVVNLRNYFLKGGFMIVDDFPNWGWPVLEEAMSRVFPRGRWEDLKIDHPIFHSFFEIDSLTVPMPSIYQGRGTMSDTPPFRAMFEDNDKNKRMYVMANYETDISEYWEFSGRGYYAVDDTNEAYKFGVNEFIYGITH